MFTDSINRLQEETAKVEGYLLNANFTDAIIACFNTPKVNAFDPNLLEPLLKALRLSPSLAASLAKPEMFGGLAQKFGHKKAVVRLNLLRLVRTILDAREADYLSAGRDKKLRGLLDEIQKLADKDPAVLVRNLAGELVRSRIGGSPNNTLPLPSSSVSSMGSNRSRSGARRIYTPPTLQSSVSNPLTPTQARRPSLSATQSAAFIEVASSPKRSAVATTHDRDAAMYRPRSRDGSGIPVPRRISGEFVPVVAQSPGHKSRLSRNANIYSPSRPSISSSGLGSRSEGGTGMYHHKESSGSISSADGRPSFLMMSSSSAASSQSPRTPALNTDLPFRTGDLGGGLNSAASSTTTNASTLSSTGSSSTTSTSARPSSSGYHGSGSAGAAISAGKRRTRAPSDSRRWGS